MLTIAKPKRWSINYYIETAQAAEHATKTLVRAGGGLGEYYSERETRTPVWLCAGDTHTTAALVGLSNAHRAGGDAAAPLVERWLDAPTVTAARGHRTGVGDLIITRRNDPAIGVFDPADSDTSVDPVRNGNRWRVYAVDPEGHRVAARRLDDGAAAAFSGEYLREYLTHGYAVTVHAAQGVTADATHAVLGENSSRSMLYVAMTRGRDANTAYLYERMAEQEYGPDQRDGVHVMQRGISPHAGQLVRAILANRDDQPITAHDIAARTPRSALPERVRHLVDRRATSVRRRRVSYDRWQAKAQTVAQSLDKARERDTSERRTLDYGLDL